MNESQKSGQRYEIIVLKVNRNSEGVIRELYALEDHFKKKGNNYTLLNASYGSPSRALKKLIAWYLDSKDDSGEPILKHPKKTLYEINKMFIDRKLINSGAMADMGIQADIEKLTSTIAHFFGASIKKPEEEED